MLALTGLTVSEKCSSAYDGDDDGRMTDDSEIYWHSQAELKYMYSDVCYVDKNSKSLCRTLRTHMFFERLSFPSGFRREALSWAKTNDKYQYICSELGFWGASGYCEPVLMWTNFARIPCNCKARYIHIGHDLSMLQLENHNGHSSKIVSPGEY